MSVPMAASPRAEMRMLVGYVLLAPFSGLVMYLTIGLQLALGVWFFSGSASLDVALPLSLAAAIFAAPIATIVGAVPGVAWLIRRDRLTLRNLLLGGLALGNIPIAILAVLILFEKLRNDTLNSAEPVQLFGLFGPVLLGAWFGVWGALFFWFVSIRGTELDVRATQLPAASTQLPASGS